MKVKSDAAGRLLDILTEAKSKSEKWRSRQVWASVFNIPENDSGSLLLMLAELIRLSDQTKKQLIAIDDIDHQLFLKPFVNVERIFSILNLESSWQPSKQLLDDVTIYGLNVCSDKLSRINQTTSLNDEDLDKIKSMLEQLTDEVLNSDLESPLKEIFIRNLEGLRQSLLLYKINGIDGIEQQIQLNIGTLMFNKENIKSSNTGNNDSLIKGYYGLLEFINKTLDTARKVDRLAGNSISRLLGVDLGG
ncbi:hypothetical protein FWP56_22730 [Vibrio vulnificus]|uniref:hypothetical protein n=1 Tax=Vibrio TaxID=662 RepID=UPI000DE478C1|nr:MULTISPECIES: hypothetical protein [Vibrio]EGQ9976301.1 hypothetical protein [Vibrio vulnificus]EKA7352320.1 hypothetical protein [Vibrio vulnificus]MBG0757405.1 hypothetical protein [Vibrio cidicii]MCU8478848.1 hypothetical protein [Vibrio vulnificus]RBM24662.1 hypothetical protein DLR59_18320 [Vibrio tarriae]